MKTLRRVFFLLSVLIVASMAVETSPVLTTSVLAGLVSKAEARMGRPRTPVSVAGAGRRTVRRCAAGVYNC